MLLTLYVLKVTMAASAVIRVKRSRDEKPLEALIISCKRQKCDAGDFETPFNTVLTFAGTVQNQEESVHSQLSKALKDVKFQASIKSHIPNVKEKLREEVKRKQQNDRFKLINFYRASGSGDTDKDSEMVDDLTVFDIESQPSEEPGCSTECDDGSENFEYDLYYAASASATDFSLGVLNGNLSVQPYDLVPDVWPEGEGPDNDSEDSNDENNWRNEYPDEEDEDKESDCSDDDGLYRRMARCAIGLEELSSDEDDENLPYEKSRRRYEAHLELGSSSSSEESDAVAED